MADPLSPIPPFTPYCGAAPEPSELWARWNLDPVVLAALAAGVLALALRGSNLAPGRRMAGGAALAVLAFAFVSPFCALTSALFSARVAHHGLLVLVAAPLLARLLKPARRPNLPAATALHSVVFWAWHEPAAYAWALSSDPAYWLMQASLIGSGVLFWRAVFSAGPLFAAGAALAGMVQMGLLGALITFAGAPLYAPHFLTAAPYGLDPLRDQQLAGLIMWAPMAGVYLGAALAIMAKELRPAPAAAS